MNKPRPSFEYAPFRKYQKRANRMTLHRNEICFIRMFLAIGAYFCWFYAEQIDRLFYQVARWIVLTFTL